MNPFFARFLNSVYRKEPISGFILIFGLTDAVLGGVGGRWSLFSVGFMLALFAIVIRTLQEKKIKAIRQERPIRYQLPPAVSNPPLPLLVSKKRRY
jgi:hypothetical protein